MRLAVSAFAAGLLLAGIGLLQPAQARCFWNGFETVCMHHGTPLFGWAYRHHFRDFDRPIYRDWR